MRFPRFFCGKVFPVIAKEVVLAINVAATAWSEILIGRAYGFRSGFLGPASLGCLAFSSCCHGQW